MSEREVERVADLLRDIRSLTESVEQARAEFDKRLKERFPNEGEEYDEGPFFPPSAPRWETAPATDEE